MGELALIDKAPRSGTAVVASEATVVPVDERRFLFLVQQTPFFALNVMRVMADRLRSRTAPLGPVSGSAADAALVRLRATGSYTYS